MLTRCTVTDSSQAVKYQVSTLHDIWHLYALISPVAIEAMMIPSPEGLMGYHLTHMKGLVSLQARTTPPASGVHRHLPLAVCPGMACCTPTVRCVCSQACATSTCTSACDEKAATAVNQHVIQVQVYMTECTRCFCALQMQIQISRFVWNFRKLQLPPGGLHVEHD